MRSPAGLFAYGVLGITVLLFLALLMVWGYHEFRLWKEKQSVPPPGLMVESGNGALHVYARGEGPLSLVFLAGSGTSSPVLDFSVLQTPLSQVYTTAAVERHGYGWSDVSGSPRDIGTMTEETRGAVRKALCLPPYVLFAHSMGALEALYWAGTYPDEVSAVIGLDPAVPAAYECITLPSRPVQQLLYAAARTGVTRLFPSLCRNSPLISGDLLAPGEREAYCALFYRSTFTADMMEEIRQARENAGKTAALDTAGTPLLFFISDGSHLPGGNWQSILESYAQQAEGNRCITLDAGHYLHHYVPELIVKESIRFIEALGIE